MQIINLIGLRYGKLVVTERTENDKWGKSQWRCICDCGNKKVIAGSSLKKGLTNSCGCLRKQVMKERHIKHGFSKIERLYFIWCGMKVRCKNPNSKAFPDYGGRGIIVCDEWVSDYLNFRDWALSNGYTDGLSIDRKDNDGNYEPTNCRWVTEKIQANNTRTNHLLTLGNKTKTLSEWAKDTGIKRETIMMRIRLGWSVNEALVINPKYGSKIQNIRMES
jgi:hypothetical protein